MRTSITFCILLVLLLTIPPFSHGQSNIIKLKAISLEIIHYNERGQEESRVKHDHQDIPVTIDLGKSNVQASGNMPLDIILLDSLGDSKNPAFTTISFIGRDKHTNEKCIVSIRKLNLTPSSRSLIIRYPASSGWGDTRKITFNFQ